NRLEYDCRRYSAEPIQRLGFQIVANVTRRYRWLWKSDISAVPIRSHESSRFASGVHISAAPLADKCKCTQSRNDDGSKSKSEVQILPPRWRQQGPYARGRILQL